MATETDFDVKLRQGHATSTDIVLYEVTPPRQNRDIWLFSGHATSTDIVLREFRAYPSGAFPTQYLGLRIRKGSGTIDLCLVAVADAPAGMGGQLRIRNAGGTTRAVYLVETTDPNASPFRIRTSTGTKAIRLKT